jgi:integrase
MALTDGAIKSFKPKDTPYKKTDGGGLFLLINPNGSKAWRYKYRFLGKEKLLAIGVYPEISLAAARKEHSEARKLLIEGVDPSAAKIEKKRLRLEKSEITFELVANEWHAHNIERWSKSHASDILHRFEVDVFPIIGKRPIFELKPTDILDLIRKIEERGASEVAKRTKGMCSQVFDYALVNEQIASNPTISLKGALKPAKKGHFAAFTYKELPEFIDKLERNEARLYPHTRLGLKLMMLTFVRTSELIGMRWSEIDYESNQWVIPAERMKMKRAHIVPLCTQALAIIDELKNLAIQSPYVFPSQVRSNKHMSNNTLLKALERMGYKGEMTGHGFRSLAMSTIKEKLGWRHEVVDRQLAHAQRNKVDAAYDRAQFLDDRIIMMQKWADYLDGLSNSC